MSGPMSFYDTLFLRFPEDAIHELEQLHCAKASQRFELAAAIRRALQTDKDKDTDIDKQIYEEKMGRLTRLSLHECLLRIALDPEIYPVTYSWDSEAYVKDILHAMNQCVLFIQMHLSKEKPDYALPASNIDDEVDAEKLPGPYHVMSLNWLRINTAPHLIKFISLARMLLRIASGSTPGVQSDQLKCFVFVTMMYNRDDANFLIEFMRDSVLNKAEAQGLALTICRKLSAADPSEPEDVLLMIKTLVLLQASVHVHTYILELDFEGMTILHRLLDVSQKIYCMATMDLTLGMLKYCFGCFTQILAHESTIVAKDFYSPPVAGKMIAIISRRILPPKELNTPGQRACYKSLLVPESQEEFQQILGLYILSYYRDDSHEALDRRIVMQRVTSNIWRPTLKTLRESRFKATEQPVKEYILAVQLQDLAIKIWVDYGGKLGFAIRSGGRLRDVIGRDVSARLAIAYIGCESARVAGKCYTAERPVSGGTGLRDVIGSSV
ncbi:hypothetical protein EW026_g5409 [Hermanssonia centrifuga]|uniref:Uncharacterized protein n=1 Tax=Hermanssonia centrifuga TaxID=98765 RepID=A0A4S4KIJ6_9APHY|nr:hypothetical protein EW026_g5409 [Hermanssonia centrifuga]